MNRKLYFVLAVLAAGLAVSPAYAGHKHAAATQQGGGQGQKGDRAQKIEAALDQLNLSATQKEKVHTILSDAKAKLQTLKGTAKGADGKAERQQITQKARQDVMAVLDDAQKAKLKEILKEGRAKKGA